MVDIEIERLQHQMNCNKLYCMDPLLLLLVHKMVRDLVVDVSMIQNLHRFQYDLSEHWGLKYKQETFIYKFFCLFTIINDF